MGIGVAHHLVPSAASFVVSAGGGAAPVLPVTAGLLGQFDAADDASFDVVSGKFQTWRDKSGNNYTATGNSNPAFQASRVAAVQGGRAAVQITQNAAQMYLDSSMPGDTKPFTVMVACQPATPIGGNHRSIIGMVFGQGAQLQIQAMADNTVRLVSAATAAIGQTSGVVVNGVSSVLGATFSAVGAYDVRWGYASIGSGTNNLSFTAGRTTELLCNNQNGGDNWLGYVFEILKYNRVLSGAEITSVETYLKTKWGLP